jgi:hypothetical protein
MVCPNGSTNLKLDVANPNAEELNMTPKKKQNIPSQNQRQTK